MDSRIGLDYIVENQEYVAKLGAALDTKTVAVKTQVFQLLSALCAYSKDAYGRVLETLNYYKNIKGERYRLQIVIHELERATSIEYKIVLLAFINCLIISTSRLQDRIRIRNEFIGLNLLPILHSLRREISTPELIEQLDVFDEQRECDEAQSFQGPDGINLNSHLDVFYAIYRQVADTPHEIPFLSILQHLLRIDPKETVSDIIWDTAETLVHRATLLENREDSDKLLRSPSVKSFTCPHCRPDTMCPNQRKQSLPAAPISSPPVIHFPVSNAPPPPPPPPLCFGAPPPPPPPPLNGNNKSPIIPPPPLPASNLSSNSLPPIESMRSITPEPMLESVTKLPQQETPVPKSKMKTINWNKIPPNKVLGKHNIWALVANSHQNSPMADLDWTEMEGLFCQQNTQNSQGSPKMGRYSNSNSTTDSFDTLERKSKKENSEITLLDGKRSLNVNIFLKQFRSSNENIIQLIRNGEHDEIGAEKLRGLLKILPEVDELDMLKSFDGDKNRLGNAEKFLLQLIQVPNYKLRIESMLLKEEFTANLSYLHPSINSILYAGEDLMTNKPLQEVLYIVVVAGNFLNSGGYAGNAAGVKLSSLQKLTDIRANKPGMNLIHYVAIQAEKKNKELLVFANELSTLENASKISVEQLNNEISTLDTRIKKIRRQINLPTTDNDIKAQMIEFLQISEQEITVLQQNLKEIECLRIQLADFFCEDPSTFKIEECFKIFQNFCEKFKQSVIENERRKISEEQAILRRKLREEQLANKRKQNCTPFSDPENSFINDPVNYDMRVSPAMSRRRIGSIYNTNGDQQYRKDDDQSPDITPNGSLRRRRSRVLSEEDEGNLMDFLRSSGHDNNTRERKSLSYGSLDRSWARRARSGSGTKKRPDLLNVDFGTDRERPSSPSPLAETKPLPTLTANTMNEENKPRISQKWRQKIESWLQGNDVEDKQNDKFRSNERRRHTTNRRSFENDSENERKLDPLPEEEKQSNTTPSTTFSSPDKHYRRTYSSEWKPSSTLEKTDVVGVIEAIEDAQISQIPKVKDKSAWRKSNLNVSNSSEEIIEYPDIRTRPRSRDHRPRENLGLSNVTTSTSLHSISEDDKRKSLIHQLGETNGTDRLQIYIVRPTPDSPVDSIQQNLNNETPNKTIPKILSSPEICSLSQNNVNNNNNNKQSIYIKTNDEMPKSSSITSNLSSIEKTPSITKISLHKINNNNTCNKSSNSSNINRNSLDNSNFVNNSRPITQLIDDKIEIDSDNIETPPVTRKQINNPCRKLQTPRALHSENAKENENYELVDKQKLINPIDQEILGDGQFDRFSSARRTRRYKRPIDYGSSVEEKPTDDDSTKDNKLQSQDEREVRLQKWQDKFRNLSERSSFRDETDTSKKLNKSRRHMSSINPKDVHDAFKNLKSANNLWNSDKQNNDSNNLKNAAVEMNDEGFEETQSLVSDTPSHGKDSTTSSCNEAKDPKIIVKLEPIGNITASEKTTRDNSTAKKLPISPQKKIMLNNRNQIASKSRQINSSSPANSPRHSSLRNKDNHDVERSNSHASLRSSRSSLNSMVSIATIKNIPVKSSSSTAKSNDSIINKRPTSAQNPSKVISRVPASRSSSSGSSIGPVNTKKKPPIGTSKSSITGLNSKENLRSNLNHNDSVMKRTRSLTVNKTPNVSGASKHQQKSNSSLLGNSSTVYSYNKLNLAPQNYNNNNNNNNNNHNNNNNNNNGTRSTERRSSSFMRPTAASATKVNGGARGK